MNLHILNPLRWRKSFLLLILGGIVFVWFAFLDTYSIWTRIELYMQKNELQEQTLKLKEDTELIKDKIERLEKDPMLLERIAREQYGMKKNGETVYKIREID
jgi:cell division protein FtsB